MSIVKLNVNGATHEVDVDPSTPLLYVLRNDLDLRGPVRVRARSVQCVYGHHRWGGHTLLHHASLDPCVAR